MLDGFRMGVAVERAGGTTVEREKAENSGGVLV